MHHRKAGRKFNRNTPHRRAMFRIMAGNLVLHERITTTDAKAKELRRIVERLITRAVRLGKDLTRDIGKIKKDAERERVIARRVHAQRQVASFLPKTLVRTFADGSAEEVDLVYKLFHEIAPRYVKRAEKGTGGGYTRIVKVHRRKGDNAPMSIIEILGGEDDAPKKKRKKKDADGAGDEEAAAS